MTNHSDLIRAIDWIRPWYPLGTDDHCVSLVEELKRELSREHVLHGRTFQAIAAREDNDDALFVLDGGRLAVVHLTWIGRPDSYASFPRTTLVESIDAFAATIMREDSLR